MRWLLWGEWKRYPGRALLAALAVAVGVALGLAVHLVNGSASDAFQGAVRSVGGGADASVRARTPLGFDEGVYARLLVAGGVEDASPVVTLQARAVHGARETNITLLGLDVLRAGVVTPALVAPRAGMRAEDLFGGDAIYFSEAAMRAAGARVGERVRVGANGRTAEFRVAGVLPGAEERRLGTVDIAAAQWRFDRLGKLSRVDLKLSDDPAVRERVRRLLPADAQLGDAQDAAERTDGLSRAYRVNLDMLALVALVTGGFLVYSAASLSVTRRARAFALVRTLGLGRAGVARQLLVEGGALGVLGATAGVLLGTALAWGALQAFGGDLGGGYFGEVAPPLQFSPLAAAVFWTLGVAAAVVGSLLPARAAARAEPAVALKAGAEPLGGVRPPRAWVPLVLLTGGTAVALLPAIGGLPLGGYAGLALLLAGGVAATPWLARALAGAFARVGRPTLQLAVQHIRGAPGAAAIALGGMVASTALTVAMATMVESFRGSVDDWLGEVLVGDLYLRTTGTGLDAAAQAALAATPGVRSISFSKQVPLSLDPARPEVTLVVRPVARGRDPGFPLIAGVPSNSLGATGNAVAVWASEPAARLYGLQPGRTLTLPLGGGTPARVAGVWRDYSRQHGALIVGEGDYTRLTGDRVRDEAGVELVAGTDPERVTRAMRERLPPELRGQVEFAQPAFLRRFALRLFDRSFAITYGLEAIALLVGLAGVAATASASAIARRREFGMLRHIGMDRRGVAATLAWEGALLGFVGGLAGVALGLAMSQVLIHVVNPQSFNWTMQTRLPWGVLGGTLAALVAAAAGTAVLAGRRAMGGDAVAAVREDW